MWAAAVPSPDWCRYVPPQRWLHNIEHGAVVALYHPCTNPDTVEQLRRVVTGCIRSSLLCG